MFTLIEDRLGICQAQRDLEATIKREFSTTVTRDIGWQGGRQPQAEIRTDGRYWFWSADLKDDVAHPRRLNWFGEIGERAGVTSAVELNTPYEGRDDTVAGFFARSNSTGLTYLFHSGRVGGGAEGVKKDALVAWADLKLQPVYAADGSHREGILVMPVTGRAAVRPAIGFVQSIIDFKAAARAGLLQSDVAKTKERELRAYFDEFFGRKTGRSQAREIDYLSRHGEVVRALGQWRESQGLGTDERITNSPLLDLGVGRSNSLVEAFEVKTSTRRSDVYTGIGQLTVHATSPTCTRTLVLPADESLADDLTNALLRNQIRLLRYRLTETTVEIL